VVASARVCERRDVLEELGDRVLPVKVREVLFVVKAVAVVTCSPEIGPRETRKLS
jgi:hypothetical protein